MIGLLGLTLLFAGDAFDAEQLPPRPPADLTWINLEGPITAAPSRPCPITRCVRFQRGPEVLARLRAWGVDGVSLANNHALDSGQAGLRDTLAALKRAGLRASGLAPLGQPTILRRGGLRIGLLSASAVPSRGIPAEARRAIAFASPWRLRRRLPEAARRLRAEVDVVIVTLHWGREGAPAPDPWQIRLAHALVDAGAQIVVGHHAHRLQGVEQRGAGIIAYGLGDLDRGEGGLLRVEFDARGAISGHALTPIQRTRSTH